MRRVPARELNQHTADVLARVERGERVEITRNGKLIAVIEPAKLVESWRASDDFAGVDAIVADRYLPVAAPGLI